MSNNCQYCLIFLFETFRFYQHFTFTFLLDRVNPQDKYFERLIDGKYHHKTIDHLDNDIEDMIWDRISYYATERDREKVNSLTSIALTRIAVLSYRQERRTDEHVGQQVPVFNVNCSP